MDHAPVTELTEYLSSDSPRRLAEWVWGLSRWGKSALVASACIGARQASQVFTSYPIRDELEYFSPSVMHAALGAAEDWLAAPSAGTLTAARAAAEAARTKVAEIELMVNELSGSATEVAGRERALAAAQACTFAAESASWEPESIEEGVVGDEAEEQARQRAGPAFEAVQAVRYARWALEIPESQIRSVIAIGLGGNGWLGPPN